jgi:hypothetical protein
MTEQTEQSPSKEWYAGGCHCGRVRFRVRIAQPSALACNCSICAKKGMINLIAAAEDFELLRGEEDLSTYSFNTGVAQHRFCKVCGIHPFSRPRSHPDGYDVNARCLDAGYDFLDIGVFDGQNWEASVDSIR